MIDSRELLLEKCYIALKQRGLSDKIYLDRLEEELEEIDAQGEHDYFLSLQEKGEKYPNDNNLFIAYLLGICDDFDIGQPATWMEGELPDIDVDFLPAIQKYLKDQWAPEAFGSQNVCNIGNYTTFRIRSSLIDMARIFGKSRDEVLAVTTNLELTGGDDEDDQTVADLSWDKALELDPALADYCERHPEVAKAASNLLERNRGKGKHAGGLIIANCRIDDIVPLMLDTNGNPVSAWTEGLHDQDLQPVGLIKFDVLVIKDLLRIAECCQIVKERHGLDSICALPGMPDWTDTSYLNDPEALALANRGHTTGVFQFSNDGMRKLIKRGGVESFEDLVAYTALIRPGPLSSGMTNEYCKRKKGEEYDLHPLLEPILGNTKGVFAYQEQIMKILAVVGKIPLIHCEKIRKAISKKNDAVFKKYKDQFIINAQKTLGWSEEEVQELWDQIAKFYTYAFNKSHGVAYTYISSRLLWLKAHYPIEFYKTTLQYEPKDWKIRNFKREAENEGIPVRLPDLNKSKVHFDIVDEEIYTGFSDIKGIGVVPAEEIVKHQPYEGLEDFLTRFGTAAKVLKPLIHLGVFEGDPAINMAFYEFFKKKAESARNSAKRNIKTREKYIQQIKDLFPEDSPDTEAIDTLAQHDKLMSFKEQYVWDYYEQGMELAEGFEPKDLWAIIKKYQRSVNQFEGKQKNALPKLKDFEIPEELPAVPVDHKAQDQYFGFSWLHRLERSPDFQGDKMFAQFEEDDTILTAPVEVMIIEGPVSKTSKKGNPYYYITVEDGDWNQQIITFWEDEYERFKEELHYWKKDDEDEVVHKGKDKPTGHGHLLRLKVVPPGPGFKSFTFSSFSKRQKKLIPAKKEDDYRLYIMKDPDD